MFPPTTLPASRELLYISDQLASPADFLLHRFLVSHLKKSKIARCLILSLSESLTRWKVLAGRANVNLTQHIASGTVVFLDSRDLPSSDSANLRSLFDPIQRTLQQWPEDEPAPLVIVDDISVLEWIGFSTEDITRFVRALSSVCRKVSAALVVRQHLTTSEDLEDLSRSLLQLCTHHMEVLPLGSGRSGSVSGEVALHPGPGVYSPSYKPIPRTLAVQYRLTDTSCVFFQRGTGNNVL